MKRKNVGLLLMVLPFLYFVAAIRGAYHYQGGGVVGATKNSLVLVLFIGGVWCLSATKRKGLGLVLMVLPFLLAVVGISGAYHYQGGGVVGAMVPVVALVILVIAFGAYPNRNQQQKTHNKRVETTSGSAPS